MLGEFIRQQGFWVLDTLRGRRIRQHYNDIKYICERQVGHEERVRVHLENLLSYAVSNSEYYAQFSGLDLAGFPIINKNTIKENGEKMLSKEYRDRNLHSMSTSGSTGTPFTVRQNPNKRYRVLAEIIYAGEMANYHIGDRNVFFKAWTHQNRKNPLQAFLQNLVMLDISRLDEVNLEKIRTVLKNDKKIKCILGIAYSLDVVSKYLLSKNDTPDMFSIETVISGAEILHEETRANLEQVFGCDVVSRYSNQENGIIAQEGINDRRFWINFGSYYIEFLKIDREEPAEIGELSRIVITDLFNYASPMIRYDTGDLAVTGWDDDLGLVMSTIEGKKLDFIYATNGDLMSPVAVALNMRDVPNYSKFKQFQLIQESRDCYTMKLNGAQGLCEDSAVIEALTAVLGSDAKITVEHVEGIPLLESGKFKKVVCNYTPEEG